jgi:hypothetical protein
MVLLSGKRKIKDSIQEQIKTKILIPYLNNRHEQINISTIKTSDPFYAQMIKVFETIHKSETGDLNYQFKTPIQIEPAYQIYHLLFGKKSYDPEKIQIIQDGLSKNYTITKIKSMFTVCQK